MFPALGFGAKIPPDYNVSEYFYVNHRISNLYDMACCPLESLLKRFYIANGSAIRYSPLFRYAQSIYDHIYVQAETSRFY